MVNTVGEENGYMLDENRMEKRRPPSVPGEWSALPANLCRISRSIPTGLWRIAADYFLHDAD